MLREEVQQLETGGLGKIQLAVAGVEVEGLYGLLWGAMSCSPMSSITPPPKNVANLQLPPSKCHPHRSTRKLHLKLPAVKKLELALEVPSPTAPETLEVAIPTHMTPLHLQLRGIKRVYKCQVEGCTRSHQSHMLLSAHIYAENTWGEVGMSLL